MNGPNVNIQVYNDLNEEIKDDHNIHLQTLGCVTYTSAQCI